MNDQERSKIVSWIEKTIEEEGFSKISIELKGTSEKGEGYIADLIFAEVTGTDQDNNVKKIHLALKAGKSNSKSVNLSILRDICKRERLVYNKVFPTFHRFQLDRNILETFDAYPKCYKTFSTNDNEVIVLENLKKNGFSLHDSRKPMNLQHIHLVLKNYAKSHALSFSMRDQNKIEFDELTIEFTSLIEDIITSFGTLRKKERVEEHLKKADREDLLVKYERKMRRGKETIALEILSDVVEETVIIHGDTHNNNFLFRYQDNDEENPLSVAIIDWQMSALHSPALDLCNFLYWCASGESLSRLEELLKFYHSHLADFMRELGSDVEKLFPYNVLVNHWKKYSTWALVVTTSFLELMYVEKEEAPAIENMQEQSDMARFMEDIKLKDEDAYRERIIAVIDHHFNFSFE